MPMVMMIIRATGQRISREHGDGCSCVSESESEMNIAMNLNMHSPLTEALPFRYL
jgi:hypothetical protein